MITSAIKIDDEQWAEWLDAVAATPKIRHIECDAALFSFSLDFLKSLDRHSLYGAHARDILPPETARFLNESPNDQAFNNLRKSIIHSMLSAENAGVSHFSLQMRLDEPFPDEENRVRKTAAFIRKLLAEKFGAKVAEDCTILYGGSCKPSNAKELFAQPDIDGGLIGGASLKAADFIAIAKSY